MVQPLPNEFHRAKVIQRLVLHPGERRGFWKHHVQKEYRQTIVNALIDDCHARVLLDSGAEVSILDFDFARKLGVPVDTSEQLDCADVGGAAYHTEGRARIKLTLAGELVYEFSLWVGRLGNTQAILGMDFMEPAGVRLDLVEGVAQLPDEIRVRFEGRRPLYSHRAEQLRVKEEMTLLSGQSKYLRVRAEARKRLWIGRGQHWVPTAELNARGEPCRLKITNVSEYPIFIPSQTVVGIWLAPGSAPRQLGFVSIGSRRYREWRSLVYEAEGEEPPKAHGSTVEVAQDQGSEPLVARPSYKRPSVILRRAGAPSASAVSVAAPATAGDASRSGLRLLLRQPELEEERQAWFSRAAIAFVAAKGPDDVPKPSAHLDDTVFVHEGGDLSAEDIEGQMAVIPELPKGEEIKIEDIQVGLDGEVSSEDIDRVRQIIWERRQYLMGPGNARPPAAKGVVCDIDVGDAKPIAQRCRRVPPELAEKLYDLLKALLEAGFIRPSTSSWASPIVIVLKKNGTDIRLCIDYRVVNALTRLMVYPMPVVHDLLEDLGALRWFCSLDMASGFWVVQMTARARAVSAFVTPFGLFEWLRMPFGLKNAPQIYQRLLDNALYGYLKLTPAHLQVPEADVFVDGEPAGSSTRPVIGRRSYIDDILFGGRTWDDMCEKLKRLMDACEEWGLSISLPKSQFGMRQVDYLGHQVSDAGIKAKPKNLEDLTHIEFPRTVKGIQSFLGSLNYYHRFIEHFSVYAAALYEVTQSDLEKEKREPGHLASAKASFEMLKSKLVQAPLLKHLDPEKELVVSIYANGWAIAGSILQLHDGQLLPVKFVSRVLKQHEMKFHAAELEVLALLHVLSGSASLLAERHVTVLTRHSTLAWLYQSKGLQGRLEKWAVLLSPWSLTIRKADKGEADLTGLFAAAAGPREKLDEMLNAIKPLKRGAVEARHVHPLPTLEADQEAWVLSFDGSAKPKRAAASCAAILWRLPGWTVEAAESWFDDEGTVNEAEYRGLIRGLEVAANRGIKELIVCGDSRVALMQLRGEFECRTPGLQVLLAEAHVNVAKFDRVHLLHVARDFNAAADLLTGHALQRCAGKQLAVQEHHDLQRLNRLPEVFADLRAERQSTVFATTRAARRREDERAAAHDGDVLARDDEVDNRGRSSDVSARKDSVRSEAGRRVRWREDVARQSGDMQAVDDANVEGAAVTSSEDRDQISGAGDETVSADNSPTTEPTVARDGEAVPTGEDGDEDRQDEDDAAADDRAYNALQLVRAERIERAQQEESWAARLRQYLRGETRSLSEAEAREAARCAESFEEVDGLLYYVGARKARGGVKEISLRLVVPTTLQQELLHHYHRSLNGGHQGVTRTFERVRRYTFWRGQYQSVRDYVSACPDCQSGKGEPRLNVGSPGNIVATRPFEVLGMDHVPSLPKSARGNTELLVWIDQHTGYLIVSANPSRKAEEVAAAYERCVYRRFGASRVIRHDREPSFMSEVFRAFNRLVGQRSRATLAYRPQANGMTERMVQTVMRAVRLYVSDPQQRDWDEYAERLVFALNTAYDRTRQDTPFYLLHGWDPYSTIETNLPLETGEQGHVLARRWRAQVQVKYQQVREHANRLLREAMEARRDAANAAARGGAEEITAGTRVWLYVDQVKVGYARKLAHRWHGPFRVLERVNTHLVRLQVDGMDYRLHPVVHVNRLKIWRDFEPRPATDLEVAPHQRLDFDEALLPEDSFEPAHEDGEYEIVAILDHRDRRVARQGRVVREYLVRWLGYDEPDWVAEQDMSAPSLLEEYEEQLRRAQGRFAAMEVEEE